MIPKKITFAEWVRLREAGTDAVMGHGCHHDGPDYQIQGDPCASQQSMKNQTLLNDRKRQKRQKKS